MGNNTQVKKKCSVTAISEGQESNDERAPPIWPAAAALACDNQQMVNVLKNLGKKVISANQPAISEVYLLAFKLMAAGLRKS